LIDGVRGSTHFGDGAWQGYWGRDFEAVVDLGRVETVRKLGAGFLQNVGSWIFMPTRVEFALSTDGQNFQPALNIANEVPETNRDSVIRDFVRTIPSAQARFVRVKAYNYGKLPAWHAGAGGDAWVFIDEIIIE
jgi:F5/8 type C domain